MISISLWQKSSYIEHALGTLNSPAFSLARSMSMLAQATISSILNSLHICKYMLLIFPHPMIPTLVFFILPDPRIDCLLAVLSVNEKATHFHKMYDLLRKSQGKCCLTKRCVLVQSAGLRSGILTVLIVLGFCFVQGARGGFLFQGLTAILTEQEHCLASFLA